MNTLAESVARFCDLRCTLGLAHASARLRRVPKIARVAGVVHDIARGGDAMASIESIIAMSTYDMTLTFAPMNEISHEDLMIRAAILLDSSCLGPAGLDTSHCADEILEELFASCADDTDSSRAKSSRVMRASDFVYSLRGVVPTQNESSYAIRVWKICLVMILMGRARPMHYELLDAYCAGYHDTGTFHHVLANILSSRDILRWESRAMITRFFKYVMRGNLAGARECIPQMGDVALKFLVSNGALIMHYVTSFERVPQIAISLKSRGCAWMYQTQLLEQFPVESQEFAQCVHILRKGCDAEKSHPSDVPAIRANHIRNALVSSAKNADDRAFEIVYDMMRELREFCGVCDVIAFDEDFDIIQRAVRRLESKGVIVTVCKYIERSLHLGTIPRFADVARFIDFVLARDSGRIAGGKYPFQAEAVQFLARVLYAFGSHVEPVIAAHFASYPSILARIRANAREVSCEWVRIRL